MLDAPAGGGGVRLGLDFGRRFFFDDFRLLAGGTLFQERIQPHLLGALLLFQGPLVQLVIRTDAPDDDGTYRPVQAVGLDAGDPVDDVESADGLTEYRIFCLQFVESWTR